MIKPDQIIRSKRRTVALEITHDARLVVRVPLRASLREIEKILRGKELWIERTHRRVKERFEKFPPKKFADGEEFLFLGKSYKLSIVDDAPSLNALSFDGVFKLPQSRLGQAQEMLIRWYRQEALKLIPERVRLFAEKSGYDCSDVRISNAKSRWGSCSRNGRLRFSWRVMMAPLEVIDYVVVHELAHLKEKNHGKAFWDRVGNILPTYEKQAAWLKDHQDLLKI